VTGTVLLYCIDPRAKKIKNESSSRPVKSSPELFAFITLSFIMFARTLA